MIMRGSLLFLSLLGKTAAQQFVNGKPDFFTDDLPAPLAYYYFNEGSGYALKDSVSNNPTAGSVIFDSDHQINSVHTEPNWVNDDFFGTTIACGEIENTANPEAGKIQKDALSLQDVDYGSNGSFAWSVWFRHEKDVNFPNYEREQFFGHGDPTQGTATNNQVHIQFETDGRVRSIVSDSNDDSDTTQDTSSELNLDDGNWHQLVMSTRADGYQGYNVYLDGVLKSSSPFGEADSDPADSADWQAAGGDAIDPVGNIRLCGRQKADGYDAERYFRGQVAHFAVWDSALSDTDVANLYLRYTTEYGIPRSDTSEGVCPQADPCDICDGPIANPLAVIDMVGFPQTECSDVNFYVANSACVGGYTPEEACALAAATIYDTCCVSDGSDPAGAPAGAPTAGAPTGAPTESSAAGFSTGAIAGIVVVSLSLML